MQHTFSSLSPTHQHSVQPISKGLQDFDEQAFINPFSLAAREPDNKEKECTADGFFQNPEQNFKKTSSFLIKDLEETEPLNISE